MKQIVSLLIALLMTTTIFAQNPDSESTGWRKDIVLSYCDEYDVMIGDEGYWVVKWGSSRKVIKSALLRSGFKITETDSTITWNQSAIYSCELQFNVEQKLKTVMYTVSVRNTETGMSISNSLKTKYESLYGSVGKFKMIGTSTAYTWLDSRCGRKPIYALMANTMVEGGGYIITVIASRIGE